MSGWLFLCKASFEPSGEKNTLNPVPSASAAAKTLELACT